MTSSQRRRPTVLWAVALGAALTFPTVADDYDDHGDGPRTATVIALGAPVGGTLGGDGDVDVFRFDLVGQTQVEIRTSGQTDTTGELTDSAAMSLATDEDSGPGDNFSIRQDLGRGVYYVHVSGTGPYAIDVRTVGELDDLHGDTLESSTLLRLLSEVELDAVTPSVLLSTAGRIFPTADDVDVFRLDVPYNGADVVLRAVGTANVNGSLVDSADMELVADDGDDNFRMSATLDVGIYYLKISAADRGAYRVMAQHSGTPGPDAGGTTGSGDDDRDGDGVPNDLDAFPDDPTETTDADANGVGDNAQPIALTYNYMGGASDGSSVSYTGQTARQMLISAMKAEIGNLEEQIGMEDAVRARLNFYMTGDGVDDTPHGFTVAGGEPVIPGPTYGDVSTGKNLRSKTAGQDKAEHVLGGEFFGWAGLADGSMPIDLAEHFIQRLVEEATDGNTPPISTVDGQVPVDGVYIDAHGRDYQQLMQKFLGGAVAFSQGTTDYLQTKWGDYLTTVDGKDYTGAEHKFDEAFGYYGAARDINDYTDDEAAAKGGRDGWGLGYHDTNGDGSIDLRAEFVFGHAQNCAKRDRGSNGATDYSKEAVDAFLIGRQILGNAAASGAGLSDDQLAALHDQIATAAKTWEKCIAATVVHYINDTAGDMGMYVAPNFADLDNFKNVAKHWGEMKGFALGLQFSPFSPFRDGSVDGITVDSLKTVLSLMGNAPVLADGSQAGVAPTDGAQAAIDAYIEDLMAARDILEMAYGFDPAVVQGW